MRSTVKRFRAFFSEFNTKKISQVIHLVFHPADAW